MIKIYGASDDLIEVEGDICEEFNFYPDDEEDFRLLAFSDGHLLKIMYDKDGIWRINRLIAGSASFSKVEGDIQKDTPDVVTLEGVKIIWVALGEQFTVIKKD